MKTRELTAGYRLSQWAKVIQERIESGERVEEFCLRKGIGKHKYYYWQQKLRKAAGEQLAKLESKPTDISVRGFTEVRLAESNTQSLTIGTDQLCIETGYFRLTAGSIYPAEALVTVLREIVKP
jgi:putative transposase